MSGALEIHDMPGHLIRRLQQISVSVFAERVAEAGYDVTPVQYAALVAISANPGIDQATLAGLIAHDRVTIGGVLDRLEQKSMIARETSARDRRARILHMTREGEDALSSLTPVVQSVQLEILGGLDESERETLLALLKKTTEAGNTLSRAPLKTG